MHARIHVALLTLVFHSLACSDDTSGECVVVDEELGVPKDRVWCGGEFPPPEWNAKPADKSLHVCLPPQSDGSCKLCPRAEVIEEVEAKMAEIVAERECELEHWAFGCMRTVESAEGLYTDNNYCCYQVAHWGPGCKDGG